MKSEVKANLHKKSGNELYLKSEHSAALIEYNKALCFAETDEVKSLLYGNRSAIYFEVKRYNMCLENIQLAIQYGYPKDKLAKLQVREEKCKKFLDAGQVVKEDDQKVTDFFKLSYEAHPKIPFIINAIELKTSEQYGNHLITNRNLNTGDIIAIEPVIPFFGSLVSKYCYDRCAFCLRNNFFNLIPCDGCCNTMYCSESCKAQHKLTSHDFFCNLPFDIPELLLEHLEMCLRMMITAVQELGSFEEVNKLLKNPKKSTIFDVDEFSTENLVFILASLAIAEIQSYACIAELLSLPSSFFELSPIKEWWSNASELSDVKNCIIQLLVIRATNSMAVNIVDGKDSDALHIFSQVGSSVLPFGSFFNHSCDENIHRTLVDDKMAFFACRPIKAGEQICISYGPCYDDLPLAQRHATLMRYDFRCDCVACKNNYPLFDDLRKLNQMIPPLFISTVDETIETFKKNCKMINKLQHQHPCQETANLIPRNLFTIKHIAKERL